MYEFIRFVNIIVSQIESEILILLNENAIKNSLKNIYNKIKLVKADG